MSFINDVDSNGPLYPRKRSNSIPKIHLFGQLKQNESENDVTVGNLRFHSPQLQRKNYAKPVKPNKPHGLKLVIPPQKLVVAKQNENLKGPIKPRSVSKRHSTKFKRAKESTGFAGGKGKGTLLEKDKKSYVLKAKQNVIISNLSKQKPISHDVERRQLKGFETNDQQNGFAIDIEETPVDRRSSDDDSTDDTIQNDSHKKLHCPDKNKLVTSRSLDDSLNDRSHGNSNADVVSEKGNSTVNELLIPKRKAPRPPHAKHTRRRSDTQIQLGDPKQETPRQHRVTAESGFTYDVDIAVASDSSDASPYRVGYSRHRYFTPQPTRRTFLDRNISFGKGDVNLMENGHYGIPPVERKALQRHVSQLPEPTPPKLSPERKQRPTTPISPLANSVKDTIVHMSNGKTLTPPLQRQNGSLASSDEGDDFSLEDSTSFEGLTIVHYKSRGDRHQRHRSLASQQNKFRDANHGLRLQTLSGVRKTRNRPQSAPITRIKTTNTKSQSSPFISNYPIARSAPKRVDGLREALLRDAAERNKLETHIPLGSQPKTMIKKNMAPTLEPLKEEVSKQHQSPQGEDETDFASLDDLTCKDGKRNTVDSASSYNVSPESTTDNSPRHRIRRTGSLSSLVSAPVSLIVNQKMFKDIFLSHRSYNRGVKRAVGFVVGLILGLVLYMLLTYCLKYPQLAAIIITAISTLFMSLSLAFTVQARCVAAMMLPTLCTSKGRNAIYAVIVAFMLAGPVHNIYGNANEITKSLSCSAELAVNQSIMIREASQTVLNAYVRGLINSVEKLQQASEAVNEIFRPIDEGIDVLQENFEIIGDVLLQATEACRDIIGSAHSDCRSTLNQAYTDCRRALGGSVRKRRSTMYEANKSRQKRQGVSGVCEVLNIGDACKLLNLGGICQFPDTLNTFVDQTIVSTLDAIAELREVFSADIDFDTNWDNTAVVNGSSQEIQDAIQQELKNSLDVVEFIFSISDKIIAFSLLWLFLRSYYYLEKYHTKDHFDNYYITSRFQQLDGRRKQQGKKYLLPLKKTERHRLIDRTSIRLSRPEKGLFKIGLSTVFLHMVIAGIIILVDYALFTLMEIIRKYGEIEYMFSSEGETKLEVNGSGFLAQMVRWLFIDGFQAAGNFNTTLNTNVCLPNGIAPNKNLSIGLAVLYVFTLLTVLFQAYALRLRSIIASQYYPEREMERTIYLYNHTLQKRQNLFKLLRRYIKNRKRKDEKKQQISINAYFISKYPFYRKILKALGLYHSICQGCKEKDKGKFKRCPDRACGLLYCEECCKLIGNVCICEEFIDDMHGAVNNKLSESNC